MLEQKSLILQLKKVEESWVINHKNYKIAELTQFYIERILSHSKQENKIIFLAEEKPEIFISIFFASVITKSCLFLINPHWQKKELEEVFKVVQPDLIFGSISNIERENKAQQKRFSGIMIPTGGTSGNIKFAIHTWDTLSSSVFGFINYWQQNYIDSFCCLPLYHVSGLMQIMRSFLSSGKLEVRPYQEIKKSLNISDRYSDFFISLVPTQLSYLLTNNLQWLKQFNRILVGGNATNNNLKSQARKYNLKLALTYGMTETASGISILKPEDFLDMNNSNGHVMPHAHVFINSQDFSAQNHKGDLVGDIKIKCQSLFKGYYPHFCSQNIFLTDDIGYFDSADYLHIIGRNSHKIITGGENVYPLEVEQIILDTNLVKDVVVLGKKDDYWGEIVTAIYTPLSEDISSDNIKSIIDTKISSYKIPKLWLKVNYIPRNSQGKVNYNRLKQLSFCN